MPVRTTEILERDRLTETYAELAIRLGLLALFLYWAIVLVRPFIGIFIWSVVLAVALYPIFQWIADRLGGRRRLAAALMTILSLLVVIGPATWLVLGLVDSMRFVMEKIDAPAVWLPHPWPGVKSWPVIGERLFSFWDLAATNIRLAAAQLAPQLKPLGNTLLAIAADAGIGTIKFLGSVVIAGFLLAPAPALVRALNSFVDRVAPDRAVQFVGLAGATIRSVAQGVIGIAALQAVLAGTGFVIVDIPGATLLTTLVLILGILQIGPSLVLLPVIVWAWFTMETGPAVAFTVYMVAVNLLDNVLKPIVMRRGLKTPIIVILIGLFGGMLSYGITGLFLGPIILAVMWELAHAWIYEPENKPTEGDTSP